MRKYFLPAFILVLAYIPGHAQSRDTYVFNSTGSMGVLNGITYEWSVGEMITETGSLSSNLVITQGLLQPFLPLGVGIKANQILANLVSVYPNPAADVVYVQPKFASGDMIALRLFDMAGRLLIEKRAALKSGTERQEMNINHLPPGQFLLQVSNRASASKSFQIQKIK